MTTALTKTNGNRPQVVKAPASGKAIIALFPPEQDGQPMTPAICRFTASGALRAVNVPMRLDPSKGETFGLPIKVGDDWKTQQNLTALAYDRMNTVAGVTFFSLPERLVDNDGKERPNPWIEQNPHGAIHFVRVAQVGFGRSTTGNLVAHALSVTFDLRTYLAQDLWSKWQGKKGYGNKPDKAAKEWGVLTPPTTQPPDAKHTLPFHIPAGVILWCDYAHPEVQSIIGEHINRQKFAERHATTICRRNILKKFFGVSKLDASMIVRVTGFIQEDRDLVKMGHAVAAAQAGEIVVDGEQVHIEREDLGVVDQDEVDAALAGEADEDSPRPDDDAIEEMAQAAVAPPGPVRPSAEKAQFVALREKIRKLCADLPNGEDILIGLEFDGLAEVGHCGDLDRLKDALKHLETEQLRVAQDKAKARRSSPAKDRLFDDKKPQGAVEP